MAVLHVRIPDDRLAVVIGPGGATRRQVEESTRTELQVDTEDSSVTVTAPDESDPILRLKARDIVLAIGRGFSPARAMRLLKDDTLLAVLDIKETTGKREKAALWRIRSRVIGSSGHARTRIEELTGASVSVYGNTVSLIGNERQLANAGRAVRLLLRGSEHSTVFHMLARRRREDALEEATADTEILGGD